MKQTIINSNLVQQIANGLKVGSITTFGKWGISKLPWPHLVQRSACVLYHHNSRILWFFKWAKNPFWDWWQSFKYNFCESYDTIKKCTVCKILRSQNIFLHFWRKLLFEHFCTNESRKEWKRRRHLFKINAENYSWNILNRVQ